MCEVKKFMNPMTNNNLDEVNHMEEEAKFTIIKMVEEEPNSKQILLEVSDKLAALYQSFRIWLKENHDSEQMQVQIAKLKAENERLMLLAKIQIQKLKENEDLQRTLEKGVKLASETGTWLYETVQDGVKEILKHEQVQKFTNNVDDTVTQWKQDERVKQGVKSFKKGTLKVAETAYIGLKKVLDDNTDESKTEVLVNEKNNNL